MANYLQMPKKQQVLALLELGWTYRRIEAETGVRRETVSRFRPRAAVKCGQNVPGSDPSPTAPVPPTDDTEDANAAKPFAGAPPNPAKTFAGSGTPPRFAAATYRTAITEKLDAGLSLQRVWQDLVEGPATAPATNR